MRRFWSVLGVIGLWAGSLAAEPYPDRWVWIFGWGLARDSDVGEISEVLETAAKHGFNGAVVSFGLDTLCKKSPTYLRRLSDVRAACERHHLPHLPTIVTSPRGCRYSRLRS